MHVWFNGAAAGCSSHSAVQQQQHAAARLSSRGITFSANHHVIPSRRASCRRGKQTVRSSGGLCQGVVHCRSIGMRTSQSGFCILSASYTAYDSFWAGWCPSIHNACPASPCKAGTTNSSNSNHTSPPVSSVAAHLGLLCMM